MTRDYSLLEARNDSERNLRWPRLGDGERASQRRCTNNKLYRFKTDKQNLEMLKYQI